MGVRWLKQAIFPATIPNLGNIPGAELVPGLPTVDKQVRRVRRFFSGSRDRPILERHRIIFYIGHLEAFDWNLLAGPLGLSSFDAEFDKLFAFGIDPVDGGLPSDQTKDWPSVEQVRNYNARLRETLDHAIQDSSAGDSTLARLEYGRLVEVAIEHRLHFGCGVLVARAIGGRSRQTFCRLPRCLSFWVGWTCSCTGFIDPYIKFGEARHTMTSQRQK